MRLHDERIAPARIVVERVVKKAFDVGAILAFPPHGFLPGELELLVEIVIDVCDLDGIGATAALKPVDIASVAALVDAENVLVEHVRILPSR